MLLVTVVAWGVVVAPVLHAADHDHGHRHGPISSRPHGADSLEHQLLAYATPTELSPPARICSWSDVSAAPARPPPVLARRVTPAQPQGP